MKPEKKSIVSHSLGFKDFYVYDGVKYIFLSSVLLENWPVGPQTGPNSWFVPLEKI